jgi:hypothetical protein
VRAAWYGALFLRQCSGSPRLSHGSHDSHGSAFANLVQTGLISEATLSHTQTYLTGIVPQNCLPGCTSRARLANIWTMSKTGTIEHVDVILIEGAAGIDGVPQSSSNGDSSVLSIGVGSSAGFMAALRS